MRPLHPGRRRPRWRLGRDVVSRREHDARRAVALLRAAAEGRPPPRLHVLRQSRHARRHLSTAHAGRCAARCNTCGSRTCPPARSARGCSALAAPTSSRPAAPSATSSTLRSLSLRWREPVARRVDRGRTAVARGVIGDAVRRRHDRSTGGRRAERPPARRHGVVVLPARVGRRARRRDARRGVAATVTAALPTQGTFEESANLPMDRVRVAAAEVTIAPGTVVPRTRIEAFAIGLRRHAAGAARGPTTPASHAVARRHPGLDARRLGGWRLSVAMGRLRRGRRGWPRRRARGTNSSHRAVAATLTGGHRFTRAPWRPWLRVGMAYASGDGSVSDGPARHLLPDAAVERPRVAAERLRVHERRRPLGGWSKCSRTQRSSSRPASAASASHPSADRWYQGSGATLRHGNYFGFQGRDGRGGDTIGTVVEGAATWRPRRWWTLRAYAGRIVGGDVVSRLFRGRRLVNGWLESTVHF